MKTRRVSRHQNNIYRCERCGIKHNNKRDTGLCNRCYSWVFELTKKDREQINGLYDEINEMWKEAIKRRENNHE